MAIPTTDLAFSKWIVFPDPPGGDLIATLPFVIPAIIIGVLLFLFQRGLDQTSLKRNGSLALSILLLGGSLLLVLYASFGAELGIGSYGTVMALLQILTSSIFENTLIGIGYVVIVGIIIGLTAKYTMIPLEPDVAAMITEIDETKSVNEKLQIDLKEIEAENKQLQVFLSEREDSLSAIQSELESMRAAVEGTATVEAPPEVDQDLLASISEKDEQIQLLENKILELDAKLLEMSEKTPETIIPPEMIEQDRTLKEFKRRAETATQVADSVISDTVEVISMIQSSNLDESAKLSLIKLVENLSKSLTKVAGTPELKDQLEPKIEMIGAVMMVHEIVDVVKKLTRS